MNQCNDLKLCAKVSASLTSYLVKNVEAIELKIFTKRKENGV